MGSVIVDKKGSAWQRHPIGWSMSGSDGSWHYAWKELLKELYDDMDYPTVAWLPVLGDNRLPCIVYVPHEELIWENEDE
jgi:hypothetical protein